MSCYNEPYFFLLFLLPYNKPIYRYHRDASGEAGVSGQGYSDTEELGVEGGYEENWRKGT